MHENTCIHCFMLLNLQPFTFSLRFETTGITQLFSTAFVLILAVIFKMTYEIGIALADDCTYSCDTYTTHHTYIDWVSISSAGLQIFPYCRQKSQSRVRASPVYTPRRSGRSSIFSLLLVIFYPFFSKYLLCCQTKSLFRSNLTSDFSYNTEQIYFLNTSLDSNFPTGNVASSSPIRLFSLLNKLSFRLITKLTTSISRKLAFTNVADLIW